MRTSKMLRVLEERAPSASILIESETSSSDSDTDTGSTDTSSDGQVETRKGEKRKKTVKRLGSKKRRT